MKRGREKQLLLLFLLPSCCEFILPVHSVFILLQHPWALLCGQKVWTQKTRPVIHNLPAYCTSGSINGVLYSGTEILDMEAFRPDRLQGPFGGPLCPGPLQCLFWGHPFSDKEIPSKWTECCTNRFVVCVGMYVCVSRVCEREREREREKERWKEEIRKRRRERVGVVVTSVTLSWLHKLEEFYKIFCLKG